MRAMIAALLVGALGLAGCAPAPDAPDAPPAPTGPVPGKLARDAAVANFQTALARMEPAAEQVCRQRSPDLNCDFRVLVDTRRGAPINAFQSLDRNGRPVLTFTLPLIEEMRNRDEIAFVIGHEAAHHIREHLARQQRSAAAGAIIGGLIGAAAGGDSSVVEGLSRAGGSVGARRFSKEHELEADALGAAITKAAGFDPVRGVAYFTRAPDPGDRFLGTHPPNGSRIATVRRVAARN